MLHRSSRRSPIHVRLSTGAVALRVAACVVAALALAAPALAAGSRAAAPDPLTFEMLSDPGGGAITRGAPTGVPVCGNGPTDPCTVSIGTNTSYALGTDVRDTRTGESGRLTGSCTVMYSGVAVSYPTRTGRADATGSQDCSMTITFPTGSASGALHEQMTLENNVETDISTFTVTGGTGRFEGLSSTHTDRVVTTQAPVPASGASAAAGGSAPATPPPVSSTPPPVSGSPTVTGPGNANPNGGANGIVRVLSVRSALAAAVAQPGAKTKAKPAAPKPVSLKPSAAPLADVTSLGLLVPVNAPATVTVAAKAGSSCSGTLAGPKTIALPAAKVASSTKPALLASLPAGTFPAKSAWKLSVRCVDPGGKVALVKRSLDSFTVLKKK